MEDNTERKPQKRLRYRAISRSIVIGCGMTLTLGMISPAAGAHEERSSSSLVSDQSRIAAITDMVQTLEEKELSGEISRHEFLEKKRDLKLSLGIPLTAISGQKAAEDQDTAAQSEEDDINTITAGSQEETDADEAARIVIVESHGISMLDVEPSTSVGDALDDNGFTDDYRRVSGEKLSDDELSESLNGGETLYLNVGSRVVETEEVELDFPVEEIEDDSLMLGEEEIEEEGVLGKAVKITSVDEDGATEERLEVLESPELQVVRVGTAEEELEDIEIPDEDSFEEYYEEYLGEYGVEGVQALQRHELQNADEEFEFDETWEDMITEDGRLDLDNLSGDFDFDRWQTMIEEQNEQFARGSGNFDFSDGGFNVSDGGDIGFYNGTAGDTSFSSQRVDADTGDRLVDMMLTQVGNRYVWGSHNPSVGLDCSGLVFWAYSQEGISIPRTAAAQGASSTPVAWSDIEVGDVIWSPTHIGVYIGDGKLVHAANPATGVVIANVDHYRASGFQVGRL